MTSVRIIPLRHCAPALRGRMRAAQSEAGRLWTDIAGYHRLCRQVGEPWPTEKEIRDEVKGGAYALHSQSVQAIVKRLFTCVAGTRTRRADGAHARFPYQDKAFQSVSWPAQAVGYDAAARRLVLPMGRGNKSLVFKIDLDFTPGAATLVWNDGFELHLVRPTPRAAEPPGVNTACVDLGEIHLAAVATDTGKALVVSGRGIRSDKRLLSKQLGEIARKRSRCTRGSRRERRLRVARAKLSRLAKRRIRDKRHKATRKVIDFCVAEGVGRLYVGDPRGVRARDCGRHHNQRVARWEMGKDIGYLGHKAERAAIACSTGDERGTSSRCPDCGHRHKPRGRLWRCRKCGFEGARDVVGAVNMHPLAFQQQVTFPVVVTYRRAGPARAPRGLNSRAAGHTPARRRSPDTGLGATTPRVAHPSQNEQATGLPVRREPRPVALVAG